MSHTVTAPGSAPVFLVMQVRGDARAAALVGSRYPRTTQRQEAA
jgi:hypothetical protein